MDEVFLRINGEMHYLWRAVDHEGKVLEVLATKRGDRKAVPEFLKRTIKRYGRRWSMMTDRLQSYGAAMKIIGKLECQECGRWLNNRAENSHQRFRRQERAMARTKDIKTLQEFAAAHVSIHNHFNKRAATSTAATPSSKTNLPRWPNGVSLRLESPRCGRFGDRFALG